MGSSDIDPAQAVDGLVRAMRDLTTDPNYKLVADVFSEFLFLKDRNDRLTHSHREVLDQYHKYRGELDSTCTRLEKEKHDLEVTIQEKIQEIVQLGAAKTRLEADLHDAGVSLEQEKKNAAEAAEQAAKELADLQTAKTKELADLEAAKEVVEQEKKGVEEAAAAAAAKAADEIAALVEVQNGLEAWKAQAEADAEKAKQDIADLQREKDELEEIQRTKEADIAALKDNIASLKEQKKQIEEALAKANEEIASLQATIAGKNTEIEGLQESMRAAEEQIASLQQTVEDKNGEIEDLHGKLTAETARAEDAIAHGEDLQAKLNDTEQSLEVMSGRFGDLDQYRILLHGDNDEIYVNVLDKIWTTIVTLVEETFRPDIDENILADPSCWNNLRNSPYLKHATQLQVPLPQSNTPAAKGMRISAVLAILSRALHHHVFRPVYLFDEDDENLVKFLRILEDEDPTREAHMRSTLLAMMPERQMEVGARRVKNVVREVSWLVQHLLGALQFEHFTSGLEAACKLACEQWMRIQQAQIKIEPYFGPPYDDFDWQVLELPEFTEAEDEEDQQHQQINLLRQPSSGGADLDGSGDSAVIMDDDGPLETVEADGGADAVTPSVTGEADAVTFHDNGGHTDDMMEEEEEEEGEIDPDEILLVVWPSMCSVESGDLMSITQGLVISKEQARPALEEVRSRSRIIPRPGSRRARTLSMPGQSRGSSPTRGGKPATSFLAQAQQHATAHAQAQQQGSGKASPAPDPAAGSAAAANAVDQGSGGAALEQTAVDG
ncbi:hypothetical protein B0H66DRAFT_485667 [Apodospora peruviana]|uniref:Uncharacterized protein n=1 Tax=Apodospora peruviana TaxID=516989 RepID=A0AAE0LYC7_9PEZI|nr:hypothetical protein B0H66DRAFT_485667 [Apodospora peruviana]